LATYKKKEPNIINLPAPTEFEVYTCVCWGCDQYFWVDRRTFNISEIRCPLCNATKSQAECLGQAKAVITMMRN
jgi:hypothetical protein